MVRRFFFASLLVSQVITATATRDVPVSKSVHALSHGKGLPEDSNRLEDSRVKRYSGYYQFSSVQFSPFTDWIVGGILGAIQQRSSPSLFCGRPWWAVLARAGMSILWRCPYSIFSVNQGTISLQPLKSIVFITTSQFS